MDKKDIIQYVDVDKIFKEKAPKVYKYTPRFLIKYLEKISNQDKLNEFRTINKDKYEIDYLQGAVEYLGAKITYSGLENLPQTGGVILVSNHPLGGLDGVAIMHAISHKRIDFRFLVNDLLNSLPNFGKLFVPINKISANTTDNFKFINEAYSSGCAVIVFPAGLVSRLQDGKIVDLKWKHSFIKKSQELNLPILPIYVEGGLSKFFYRFAKIRAWFGIKFNIEMLYLADEMFMQKNKSIHVQLGPLIQAQKIDNSKTPTEWASLLKDYVYSLPNNPNKEF